MSLGANGSTGPETEAITPSSSAFHEVPLAACTIKVDERNLPRPGIGAKYCDAGAFEFQLTPQVISFTAPSSGTFGAKVTLSATGGGSGNPVVFSVDSSSGSGVCSVSGSKVHFTGVGTCVLDANQASSAGFDQAAQVQQSLPVHKATTTTALALSRTMVTHGHEQKERLSVSVSPEFSGTLPFGTVTVTESTTSLCSITLASGQGSCSLTAKQLKVGPYQLIATFGGDKDFRVSVSPDEALTVNPSTGS